MKHAMQYRHCTLAPPTSSQALWTATSVHTISAWANFEVTSSVVRASHMRRVRAGCNVYLSKDPVTSVVPSQDGQTYLATTLDGHVRLMDASTGKMLNDFKGATISSYRCRSCFGHGEASVVCGDEDGRVWAWDLLDVRALSILQASMLMDSAVQAAPLQPNPPPRVHDKSITWVECHPVEANELVTAGADGSVKVWRHPTI